MSQKAYFLLLLPLFFIFHGYNELFGYITGKIAIKFFVAAIALILIMFGCFKYLLKNNNKAALLSFFFALFFLTFGGLHDFLKGSFNREGVSKYSIIIPLASLSFILLFFYLKRSNDSFIKVFLFLNTLMLIFAGIEIIIFSYKSIKQPDLIDNRFTVFKKFHPKKNIPPANKPDIFFLVFDAMPSSKAMIEEWHFNNSKLDSFLSKEGFYVAPNSKSNYNITMLSVSSCFNMEYLLPEQIYTGGEVPMIEKASFSLIKNSTTEILKKEGYKIFQFQPLSANNKQWRSKLFFENLMTDHYWLKTFPGRIYTDIGWNFNDNRILKQIKRFELLQEHLAHKEAFTYTIESIKKACSMSNQSKFVYGHFMLPHGPYIFDSTGTLLLQKKNSLKNISEVALFIDQVKFVNLLIYELVHFIKKNNKKNTVIVIEGDHGFRNIYGNEYMIFDNLNAIYFPDKDYRQFNPAHSPINTFRYVFNKYFDADLPALKDSSSYIPYTLLRKDIK